MSYEYQILGNIKSRVASIKANFGLPATTPIIDRLLSATAQLRARIAAVRGGAAAPPAAPPAAQYYPLEYSPGEYTEYQVEEEKPEIK